MIDFYATISADYDSPTLHGHMPADVAYLLPASSWYRVNFRAARLPAHIRRVGIDVGGYVAMSKWQGRYPYEPAAYIDWIDRSQLPVEWSATMDYPCERSVAGSADAVRRRQYQTTLRAWQFWQNWRDCPWVWVPTIQGWTIDDYVRHARELAPLLQQMQAHYQTPAWRVGIGSLCNRVNSADIRLIVSALSIELPGMPFHLWGVKRRAIGGMSALPAQVVSVDSAAWNGGFGSNIGSWKQSGLTKRRYEYSVELPRYLASLRQSCDNQQTRMF